MNQSIKVRFVAGLGVATLSLVLWAIAGAQPLTPNRAAQQLHPTNNGDRSQSAAQTGATFDLSTCQEVGPGLYQCPGSDKPICDPGYNRGDVDCIRVDQNGVLIRAGAP